MKIFMLILFSLLVFTYPVLVYFSLDYFEIRYLGLFLVVVLALRFILMQQSIPTEKKALFQLGTVAGMTLGLAIFIFNQPLIAQFYPVLMSGLAFGLFFYSLWYPPTIIELFARIQEPNLPPSGVQYTRKVTIVWCCFFIVNGCIASYTILIDNIALWTLYNGLISYLLMGLLFGIEWIIRQKVKK